MSGPQWNPGRRDARRDRPAVPPASPDGAGRQHLRLLAADSCRRGWLSGAPGARRPTSTSGRKTWLLDELYATVSPVRPVLLRWPDRI